jgi:hypothetical protein
MQNTSSARQLHNLLKEAWDFEKKENSIEVWNKILGGNQDPYDTSDKIVQLICLCNDVKGNIRNLNSNSEKYIKAIDKVQYFLVNGRLLDGNWENASIQAFINEETLALIDACADLMESQNLGFRLIDHEELEKLRQDINILVNEIIKSHIEEDVKSFLIDKLNDVDQAIIDYTIKGSINLDKTSKQNIGSIFLKWPFFSSEAISEAEKIINLLLKINGMMTLAGRGHQVIEKCQQILSALPPHK